MTMPGSTPAERIRHLVETGKVAPEEGERLLAAMSAGGGAAHSSQSVDEARGAKLPTAARSRSLLAELVNPFDRFGGGTAAIIGLVVSALSVLVSRLGVHFDGFLDLHIPPVAPPVIVALEEQLVSWILPAVCFWLYARVMAGRRPVRFIDFIGMVGLARLPLLLAAVPLVYLTPTLLGDPRHLGPMALVVVGLALLFVAANIMLLYQGFKNASGLAGPKLVVGFIVLLIAAEVISKLALGLVI